MKTYRKINQRIKVYLSQSLQIFLLNLGLYLYSYSQKMKRKPSSEQFNQQLAFRQAAKKSRSPLNPKKPKPKFQNQVLSFLAPQKSKTNKHKQEFQRNELKGDSQNSTANCTFSRSRIPKGKKTKQREQKSKKHEHMSEKQIMDIINKFATKIQRQWRVYLFRRNFKQFLNTKIKKHRKSDIKNTPGISAFEKLKFDQNKIKNLSSFTDNGQQIVSSYNLQKYEEYKPSSQTNSKQFHNNEPLSYRSQSNSSRNSIRIEEDISCNDKKKGFVAQKQVQLEQIIKPNKTKSRQEKQMQRQKHQSSSTSRIKVLQQKVQKEQRRISYDPCQIQKRSNMQNRRRSTGDLNCQSRQLKNFQIDKAFQIKIEHEIPLNPAETANMRKLNESSPVKRGEDQREGFNIKYPFDKALKSKKKQIQDYKQRKLLSIQTRFKRKEVTERSYLQKCRKIHEEHDNRLAQFKLAQVDIRLNWSKLLAINRDNNKFNQKYLQDELIHNSSISNIDASASFDRWDFNSSAKKQIDGNLQQLNEAQNKNYSLQSVLKYLEEEETEKENDEKDRKFRKKSKPVIQVIAQRSKEISDKSVEQFHELGSNIKKQKQKYEILQAIQIEEDLSIKKTSNIIEEKPAQPIKQTWPIVDIVKQQLKEESIQFDVNEDKLFESSSKKRIEPKTQSQSLLISQIEAASPSQNIYSDRETVQSGQKLTQSGDKTILHQLLFKNFQSDEKKQKQDRLINKFIELVNEKMVLSNIKVINSIKFMFAKMGDQRKQQQKIKVTMKFPPIESDINAINTWLLEISHFILDNYQTVIRDNLVVIKQPASIELLGHVHKNIPYLNPYETIPQYVFKDFQFYYIKTLSRNYGIGADKYDAFSTLLYTFHRSLIDSLNLALMQELISGKRWLELPWCSEFKQKKKVKNEHAKFCLERSINVVSNWGEYGLGRIQFQDQIAELQHKQYEEEKINLVCKEEALDLHLYPIFTEGNLLLTISTLIFQEEISNAYNDIFY